MVDLSRPVPVPSPETIPFWEACQRELFTLPRCSSCGFYWFPPSGYCQECWSESWTWDPASGEGILHSFVVFKRQYHVAFPPPYAVGVVSLKEGPNVLSRIETNDPEKLEVGIALGLLWDQVGQWTIPAFRPLPKMRS